jgi:hypothetical protein
VEILKLFLDRQSCRVGAKLKIIFSGINPAGFPIQRSKFFGNHGKHRSFLEVFLFAFFFTLQNT